MNDETKRNVGRLREIGDLIKYTCDKTESLDRELEIARLAASYWKSIAMGRTELASRIKMELRKALDGKEFRTLEMMEGWGLSTPELAFCRNLLND